MFHEDEILDQFFETRGLKNSRRKSKKERTTKTQLIYKKEPQQYTVNLKNVVPMTENQRKAFKSWESNKNLVLHGTAGTGKSYIAFYLALRDILKSGVQKRIVIIRSALPTRDIGFLPGSLTEKLAVYEAPYISICNELTGHPTAYENFKRRGLIEFESTSFLRGLTISDAIVIFDEFQNAVTSEVHTVITRFGNNTNFIFCGDHAQVDLLARRDEHTGINTFLKIASRMQSVDIINFTTEDIVRSGLVKEYLIAQESLLR